MVSERGALTVAQAPVLKSANAGTVERTLILNFMDLPPEQKDIVQAMTAFGNDRWLEWGSADFGPEPGETWAQSFGSPGMLDCLARAQAGGFTGTVSDYLAQQEPFLGWVLAQDFDLDVTRILIRICW